MLKDDVSGAAGGAGGDGKGGAGAEGAGGAGGKETPSLIDAAGAKKEGAGDGKGDDAAGKAAAEKAAADRSAVEKEIAKDLEGKTDAEKKALIDKKLADKAAAGKDGKKEGAPEKYAEFKLPEGMQIDQAVMTDFTALAKKHNLSQESAQDLVDFQAKMEKSRVDAAVAEFDKTAKAWRDETVKELGANFGAEEANVGRFLERFGSPELRALMTATRVGENKHLFTAMAKAGALLGEGKLPEGQNGGGQKDAGSRWYPKMREQMESGASK